jgi:bacterioferritin-associated ferredoxin
MYVCICNRYRDAEICQVARSGVRCAHAAYSSLGNGPRCGRCLAVAQNLIDQIHQSAEQHRACPASAPDDAAAAGHHASAPRERHGRSRRLSPFATVRTVNSGNVAVAVDD